MKLLSPYDEKAISKQLKLQRDNEWDLERSINWKTPIDLNKPLVPLDENALLFPGASKEERLAISQVMGLVIAASICEMEECLARLRPQGWNRFVEKYPVNPEFTELGEQFFAEEHKHSQVFRRFLAMFAEQIGIETSELLEILPKVENTKTEAILKRNLESGGYSFWWIVAQVEQEFLLLYNALAPYKKSLEPLYFDLHRKHFEEEARHASFPYLLLELLINRDQSVRNYIHLKTDLIASQVLQAVWTLDSLMRIKKVKKLANKHPMFEILARLYPVFEAQPKVRTLWQFFTRVPYVSSLVNPFYHRKFLAFADRVGAPSVPFPVPDPSDLVGY